MKIVTEYPDGLFSWVDLTSTDVEASKAFYTQLFGWDAADLDDGQGNYIYTMFTIDGHNVAGLGGMQPEMQAQGMPSHWMAYVNHSDVDHVAEKANTAGGQMVVPPMDVMKSGRMMIVQDPTGAMLGVWQPKEHIGANVVNQPNSLVWNELQTGDLSGARSFYETVFGWETEGIIRGM